MMTNTSDALPTLQPVGPGAHFAFYGDSCSGIPNARHEANLKRINDVVRHLDPPPQFIAFPGDEVIGLVADETALRAQWRHWFEHEMAWLDTSQTPLLNATGNHTVYDAMSARVYADVMGHLPDNGPADALKRNYVWRRGDLAIIVVDTMDIRFGGEGHVDLEWLARALETHQDARWTFVMGHQPAFPVNGYTGPYQRTLGPEYVRPFWQLLKENGVMAYLCSHILAFDVQVYAGVLQICSAGAGTAHRMPEDVEYLHCVQMAVDGDGLRYQTLDDAGQPREALSWPPPEPAHCFELSTDAPAQTPVDLTDAIATFAISGQATADGLGARQTLLAAVADNAGDMPLWIGLSGQDQRLMIALQPTPGRSPHQWLGPTVQPGALFAFDLMLHPGMGPGGLLWRQAGQSHWTSMDGASPWGLERLTWPGRLVLGQDTNGGAIFRGARLACHLGATPQPSIWRPS